MKPNFALTLSFDGIRLMHRAFPGWHFVGEVSLDDSDLGASLAALHDMALKIDASGVRSKLVLPNDQIRYFQIDAEGLGPDEIGSAVARALDGTTPYPLTELAYDWSISAGQVYVAAVARETLAEAEAFAADHGFNPLGFVAIPDIAQFVGEPWFGQTKMAEAQLPKGGFVERDTAAVRVIGTARIAGSQPELPAFSENEQLTPDVDAVALAETEDDSVFVGDIMEPEAVHEAGDNVPVENVPESESIDASKTADVPLEAISLVGDGAFETDKLKTEAVTHDMTFAPAVTAEPIKESTSASDLAMQTTAATDDALDHTNAVARDSEDTQVLDVPAPNFTFSSIRIRATRSEDLPKTAALSGASKLTIAPLGPELDLSESNRSTAPSIETPSRAATPIVAPLPPADTLVEATPEVPPQLVTDVSAEGMPDDAAARLGASLRAPEEDWLSVPFSTQTETTAPTDKEYDAAPSFSTRRSELVARIEERSPARSPLLRPAEPTSPQDERQRMTIFGAREEIEVGGKPKFLGVMLTAALLVFLVGVAAWASIFLDDGLSRILRSEPETNTVASVPSTPVEDATTPEQETQQESETDLVQDLADEEPEFRLEADQVGDIVASLPDVTSDADEAPRAAALPEARPARLSADEARARYAATGIWQRAPSATRAPETIALDDFYLVSVDPKVTEQDAIALPEVRDFLTDVRPVSPLDPPAPGTEFTFDERGVVRATPEGALTPNGLPVFAGQPALTPPERPEAQLEAARRAAEGVADALSAVERKRLAALRPNPRPGDLVEQTERTTLGGRTRTELATLRPKLRPQSAQQLAEQVAAASAAAVPVLTEPDQAAVDAAVAAVIQQSPVQPAAVVVDPLAGSTAQAVALSRKPKTRPNNFATIVQRSQQAEEPAAVQTAAVVPSNQRVAPSAPTATTVARAATDQNALKLRRLNLIGVYGSPSDRRALVRLPSGRYQKVKVGDGLDGGQVSAIGDGEIRYIKRGKNIVLQIPSG